MGRTRAEIRLNRKILTRRNKAIIAAKTRAAVENRRSATSAHVRSLPAMADSSSVSISTAHSVTRSEVETHTVVKKIVPHSGSSTKGVPIPIPNSDDIWDSV